jgi:hypothetical protein
VGGAADSALYDLVSKGVGFWDPVGERQEMSRELRAGLQSLGQDTCVWTGLLRLGQVVFLGYGGSPGFRAGSLRFRAGPQSLG